MSLSVDYPSYSAARSHFKELLDATAAGRSVTVERDGHLAALVPADRLREHLAATTAANVSVFREDGRFIALMEGRPFVSEGTTVDEALADLLVSLREYAADWNERLKVAPNHQAAWALVQLVQLSTDEQLFDWFDGGHA